MMDPYAVLGLPGDADPDAVTRAFRELAKQHHPDHSPPDAGTRMAEINAAYEQLKRQLAEHGRRHPARTPTRGERRRRGDWLAPRVRRQLGEELVEALDPREPVLLVADAATWDSPFVRLVLTDRRVVWLRDDAPVGRVRTLPYARIARTEVRQGRRGSAELRLIQRDARRVAFAALRPDTLDAMLRVLRPRLAA